MVNSYIVDNDNKFRDDLQRLGKLTQDFRIPFSLIANDFYKSEQQIFQLKGPGLYPDLKEKTKEQKRKSFSGEVYPILFRNGRLAASLLNRTSPDAVFSVSKTELYMGTDVPYAIYHQSDAPRSRIPLRKMVFIDGGPLENSKGSKNGRRERWGSYIEDYINKALAGEL